MRHGHEREAGTSHGVEARVAWSERELRALVRCLLQTETAPAFAVGAVYTNVTGVNPATELGYGTWSAFGAGKVLAGFSSGVAPFDVVEAAIGSGTHSHTYTEVLQHTHPVNVLNAVHSHPIDITTALFAAGGNRSLQGSDESPTETFDTQLAATAVSATTSNPSSSVATGTTAATANLPAAIVVHFWKRTA